MAFLYITMSISITSIKSISIIDIKSGLSKNHKTYKILPQGFRHKLSSCKAEFDLWFLLTYHPAVKRNLDEFKYCSIPPSGDDMFIY